MLELLHRWVRSYEVVEVRGSVQTQMQGQEELLPLRADADADADAGTGGAFSSAIPWGKDTWDAASQCGRTREKSDRDSSAIDKKEEFEGEDDSSRSSSLSSEPPFLLRNNSANSVSSMCSFFGSRAFQEEGEGEASLVCNSSLSSEPPPFLQRNSSISSMRSFASQRSLSSEYGGETNRFGRLLDVETELPMILA